MICILDKRKSLLYRLFISFKPPVPIAPWEGVQNATQYGRPGVMYRVVSKLSKEELAEDVEDCLNLCVYTNDVIFLLNKFMLQPLNVSIFPVNR